MPVFWRPVCRIATRRAAAPTSGFAARPTAPSFVRQQQRFYSAPPPPRNSNDRIKFWPFFAIIGLGSAGYIGLVNRRKGELALAMMRGVFVTLSHTANHIAAQICLPLSMPPTALSSWLNPTSRRRPSPPPMSPSSSCWAAPAPARARNAPA